MEGEEEGVEGEEGREAARGVSGVEMMIMMSPETGDYLRTFSLRLQINRNIIALTRARPQLIILLPRV